MEKKGILKKVLIITGIILLILLINLGRKVYIISEYNKKVEEQSKITNYYKKMNENEAIAEFWRKGDIAIYKRTSSEGIRMIYFGKE